MPRLPPVSIAREQSAESRPLRPPLATGLDFHQHLPLLLKLSHKVFKVLTPDRVVIACIVGKSDHGRLYNSYYTDVHGQTRRRSAVSQLFSITPPTHRRALVKLATHGPTLSAVNVGRQTWFLIYLLFFAVFSGKLWHFVVKFSTFIVGRRAIQSPLQRDFLGDLC